MDKESQYATNNELLSQIAEGDEAAFRQLFHQYAQLIHSHIYSIIKSETHTKDLVQDSFLRVWIHRDKLPGIENFRSWLVRIAYNLAFSYLRDKAIHERGDTKYAVKYSKSDQHSAEDDLHLQTLQQIIRKTVENLPPQQKKIYLLSREEGLKIPEIAAKLGLAVSTVKNTLGRALEALRGAIGEEELWLLVLYGSCLSAVASHLR
ncbi:MAG TPA: RNA polymerase sigma-70 factor [Chitinophagaceae bacterium]|nr:RNA polymerase sigma-70 factor [Chitinophagaceae bacterium]